MKVVKSERIHLSKEEDRAWDLFSDVCTGLVRECQCPEIVKQAQIALNAMDELVFYLEED